MLELFAGIGGLGMGLMAALGALPILQAELDPLRRHLLAHHYPSAVQLADVQDVLSKSVHADSHQLIVAGGFPCRGASCANLSGPRGLAHPQTGLWSVMAKAIERFQPALVIAENVVALRGRGLRTVLSQLDAIGYDVLWGTLSAWEHGAPHRRDRLFMLGRKRGTRIPSVLPKEPDERWWPWAQRLPPNDHRAAQKKARVMALGDAVLPAVAYSVGKIALQWLFGADYAVQESISADLSSSGIRSQGRTFKLRSPADVWKPARSIPKQHWVVMDPRFQSASSFDGCLIPPAIGRRVYDHGDAWDVELPGGEVEYFPREWLRPGPWPTPIRSDGKNLGGVGQYERNSPSLNALVQHDSWEPPNQLGACGYLEDWGPRGVGPSFLEWMMGFPIGYTECMRTPHDKHSLRSESASHPRLHRGRESPHPA